MKIRELIKFLSKFDGDTEVVTYSGNFEMNHAIVPAGAYMHTASEVLETFRDSFDGETYRTTVYKPNVDGERVVMICG